MMRWLADFIQKAGDFVRRDGRSGFVDFDVVLCLRVRDDDVRARFPGDGDEVGGDAEVGEAGREALARRAADEAHRDALDAQRQQHARDVEAFAAPVEAHGCGAGHLVEDDLRHGHRPVEHWVWCYSYYH